MKIELLINDTVFTTIETTTPELEFATYKEMFLELTGWREQPPVLPTLDELKQQKYIEMSASCANAITAGFVSSCSGQAVKYDSDKDTQLTMQGIALNVNSPIFASKYPNGCPVRGYVGDSTTKTVQWLNAEQVLALLADLSDHIGQCKQKGWGIQASIEACLTVAEVEAIEWI